MSCTPADLTANVQCEKITDITCTSAPACTSGLVCVVCDVECGSSGTGNCGPVCVELKAWYSPNILNEPFTQIDGHCIDLGSPNCGQDVGPIKYCWSPNFGIRGPANGDYKFNAGVYKCSCSGFNGTIQPFAVSGDVYLVYNSTVGWNL